MVNKSSLQNRLKAVRNRLGVSQNDLAARAGVARQTVGGVEAGTYALSLSVALKIAAALGCSVDELFWLDDDVRTVNAVPAAGGWPEGDGRVALARVDGSWVAHSLSGDAAMRVEMVPADGIAGVPDCNGEVEIKLIDDATSLSNSLCVAGCAPALSLWTRSAERWHPSMRVHWVHTNSTDALGKLRRGEVHAAGLHLFDKASGEFNVPQVRRVMGDEPTTLINLGVWEEGFVIAKGNRKSIRSADDLTRSDVAVVNREQGAGARDLLDEQLARCGALSSDVPGYARVERSHYDVARSVRDGNADVGIGVAAVAAAFGLGFVPLRSVRYDLALRTRSLEDDGVRSLVETLDHRWVKTQMQLVGGYDTSRMGEVVGTT